jgi:lysophospholipase L1-like esterase
MPTITIKSEPSKTNQIRLRIHLDRYLWLRAGVQFILLTIIAIAGLEILFRLWGVGAEIFIQPDQTMGCRHIPNKLVVWRCEGYSQDHFNSAGLRDNEYSIAKPANTKRIAILGDSTTEGLQVPLEKTYPKVLETLINKHSQGLKYQVINFACSSYSTGQELLQYQQQVLSYKPDIVALLYNMGDAQENVLKKEPTKAEVRPYFALNQEGRLLLDDTVLKVNKNRLTANRILNFLSAHSRIYGALAQAHFTQTLNDSRYRKFSSWITNMIWPQAKCNSQLSSHNQSELKVTSALIQQLNRQTKEQTQQFVLLTYPCLDKKSQYFAECKLLSKLGKEESFPVLDLSPSFISYPYYTGAPPPFYSYHLSPAGHQLVAFQLAYLLEQHGLINNDPSTEQLKPKAHK